jgi:hypothetical protein
MLRPVIVAALAIGTSFIAVPGAHAQGLVPCAPEHGFCRVPYPTRVVYGVPGRSAARDVAGRGIPCSNDAFGDPAPGIPKRCAYIAHGYGRGEDGRSRHYEEQGGWHGGPRRDYRGRDRGFDRGAWQICARENGFCSFRGTKRVRYGAGGRFVELMSRGGIGCNNGVFGDPAPGRPKTCQVLD